MLKSDFVPVAIDQWYQRGQDDAEGRFYQKVVQQGPRKNLNQTTQGSYIVSAAGKLIGYNNNFGPDRIRKLMKSALARKHEWIAKPIAEFTPDSKFPSTIPEKAVVIQVNSKVLGGYAKPRSKAHQLIQKSIGFDNLWILESELQQLANGKFPDSLIEKICRFHLVDNTRGEPPMWTEQAVKESSFTLGSGVLRGRVALSENDGKKDERSYSCNVLGFINHENDKLTRFDLVFEGDFQGEGPWTAGAPKGKFPLVVSFRIADKTSSAYHVRPQPLKAFGPGYLKIGQ